MRSTVGLWAKFCCGIPKSFLSEYITATEMACQSLNTNVTEEFRADIYRVLRHCHPPKPNLRKEEWKALKQLKQTKIA